MSRCNWRIQLVSSLWFTIFLSFKVIDYHYFATLFNKLKFNFACDVQKIYDVENLLQHHYVKSVRIRSFSGPYFSVFGLNKERYSASLGIHSKCEKIPTRKTPNTDNFHAVQSWLTPNPIVNTFGQPINPHTNILFVNILSSYIHIFCNQVPERGFRLDKDYTV